MAKSAKYLLIGSTEPYSGKSTIALGIARQFQAQGVEISYGKPVGLDNSEQPGGVLDIDAQFVAQTLNLPETHLYSPVLMLSRDRVHKRISQQDQTDYVQSLTQCLQQPTTDLVLLEGPGSLQEGYLFNLSLAEIAKTLDAAVILVERLQTPVMIDHLLYAQQQLGDHLIGAVINDFPQEQASALTQVKVFLEQQGIPVLGVIPSNALLRSVSVEQLVKQLRAEVLCCGDHLDLMVETLSVGAMNVSAAMKYFDRTVNMAVVTGADRTDIQLAALEKSTHCLVLTGPRPTDTHILSRAEDLEIPVLWVDRDTLTTVEIIDHAFGHTRLHQANQVECITQLMAEHFQLDQLIQKLGLAAVANL